MDINTAYRLLGAAPEDSHSAIKSKFRKLMHRYHPDASIAAGQGTGSAARNLIEAYELISAGRVSVRQTHEPDGWGAALCPWAYCERDIFDWSDLRESFGLEQECLARGKYSWDPELEEFPLFVRSVYREAENLLKDTERQLRSQHGMYASNYGSRDDYIRKIFYLLAQEFILPGDAIGKTCRLESVNDPGSSCYRIPSAIILHGKEELKTWNLIFQKSKENCAGWTIRKEYRQMILIFSDNRFSGRLDFEDDSMLFVLPPLLPEAVSVGIREKTREPLHQGPYARIRVSVELLLTIPDRTGSGTGRGNEIRYVLDEYRRLYC